MKRFLGPSIVIVCVAAVILGGGLFAMTSASNQIPPQKQAIIDNRGALEPIPSGLPTAPKTGVNAAAPIASPDPAWPSGIINDGVAPFPAAEFTLGNVWQDLVNGSHVQVFAGALGSDSSQGVFLVVVTSLDGTSSTPSQYLAPIKGGLLRVTRGAYPIISAIDAAGAKISLDLSKRSVTMG